MSESYKRDGKVEVSDTVGSGCGDPAGGSELRGSDGIGWRGVEPGTEGKPKRRVQQGQKITLKSSEKKWLREHFPNTKNAVLCEYLGMSVTTLHKFARKMKLKKSPEFMTQCNRDALNAAREYNVATGYEAARRAAIRHHARCKKMGISHYYYKKGETNVERYGAEKWRRTVAKMQASRNKAIARDKRRVSLGLEPLTKLVSAVKMSSSEKYLRCYLKKRYGYIVKRGDAVIRYDDQTRRNEALEARAKSMGLAVMHMKARLADQNF